MRGHALLGGLAALALAAWTSPRSERTREISRAGGRSGVATPLFQFLPASGAGAPVASDLCDAVTTDDKAGNWWCLKGDGTYSSAAGLTTTLTGTSLVTRPRCSNGLNCNTQAGIYADSTDSIVATSETLGTTAVSLVVQHMPKDLSAGESLLGFSAVAGSGHFIAYHSTTTYVCQVQNTGGSTTTLVASGNSVPRAWQTFACTYEDNGSTATLKAYRDGVLVGTNTSAARPLPTSVIIDDAHAAVGSISPGLYAGHFVTAKVLSADDLLRIHNASMGTLTGSRGETVTFSRSSAQTCDNGSGSVTVLPSGRPCVAQGGYLSEGAATNLALRSEELDHASWVDVGTPATSANGQTGVDGTLTGDTLTDNDAAALEGESQSVASTSQTKHTLSCWMKAGTATEATLRMTGTGNSAGDQTCTFTSISSSAWDRKVCTSGAAYGAGITNVLGEVLIGDAVGDTGTLHIWGCQLENQAFASSYIRTEGSTATRNATRLYASGSLLSTIQAGAGSMCVTYKVPIGTNQVLWDSRTIASGAQPGWSIQTNGSAVYTEYTDATGSMYTTGYAPVLNASTKYCTQRSGTGGTEYQAASSQAISVARPSPAMSGLEVGAAYYGGLHAQGFIGALCIDKRTTGCRP